MAGESFKVGRFAHSLRVRLMREHLGIDVDAFDEDIPAHDTAEAGHVADVWDPDAEQRRGLRSTSEESHHAERARNTMRDVKDAVRQGEIMLISISTTLGWRTAVIHGFEDVGTKNVVRGLHLSGLKRELLDATLKEGTSNYTRDGEEAPSSASALLPISEGQVVAEFQPLAERAHGISIEENAGMGAQERVGSALADADVEKGQLFCSPVDVSMASEPYNQPSLAQMGKNDGNPEEQRTHRPHSMSRKHLNTKSSQSPWTVPTRKPKYDADSFEDPVCDEFWKSIWVACAAHNVGVYGFSQVKCTTNCQIPH